MTTDTAIKPISVDSIAWSEWSDVPNFDIRYRHLTLAATSEDYHVGVAIEELKPGKQTAPFHYHIHEEEHVYVLEGTPTVRLGAQKHRLKPGDYVCFPASQKAGHCLINESDRLCRYVIVGENNPNEVSVYPDSNKVLIRALGRRALFDLAATRNYWDGENTGLPPGEHPPADSEVLIDDPAMQPKPPISEESVPWDEATIGEKFGGRARHLTYAAVGEGYRVGMLMECPAPGRRMAPRHYHMLEEEHALILEGEVTLLLEGEQRHALRPGDYVYFPAGRRIGHAFLNSGTGPCRYLMIGEHNPNEVCVYPDSNKMAVGPLRTRQDIFDMSGTRNYYDGEA
jgi:uncharacterized cupin superfamily protein